MTEPQCTAVDLAGTNFIVAAPFSAFKRLLGAVYIHDRRMAVEVPVMGQDVTTDDWKVRPAVIVLDGLELATPWAPKTEDVGDVGMAIALARRDQPEMFDVIDDPLPRFEVRS